MTAIAEAPAVSENRVLSLIGVGHFLSHFYLLTLPPMFLVFSREFEVGFGALGLALAGYGWVGGILQAPVGAALDKIGARQMLAAGLALNATAIMLIGFSDSYWQLFVLAVLAGTGNSVFHPVDYAIIAAKVREKRLGRAYSLHTFSGFAGGAAAPLVIGGLAMAFDWRMAFIIVGVCGIGAALLIFMQGDRLEGERVVKDAGPDANGKTHLSGRALLLSPPVLLYFLFLATYGLATGAIGSQGVVAMNLMGLATEAEARGVLSAYQAAIAIGILTGGVLAERYGRHGLTAAVALLGAAALLLLPPVLSPTGALLFAIFIGSGFGFGIVLPARDLMVRAITPPGASGRVFGFVFVGLSIGSGASGPIFGQLVDAGFQNWLFPIAGILLVIAVIITTLAQMAANKK